MTKKGCILYISDMHIVVVTRLNALMKDQDGTLTKYMEQCNSSVHRISDTELEVFFKKIPANYSLHVIMVQLHIMVFQFCRGKGLRGMGVCPLEPVVICRIRWAMSMWQADAHTIILYYVWAR